MDINGFNLDLRNRIKKYFDDFDGVYDLRFNKKNITLFLSKNIEIPSKISIDNIDIPIQTQKIAIVKPFYSI